MSRIGARIGGSDFGKSEVHEVHSLTDRLVLINKQVFKSLRDPSIRALALDLVRGTPQHGNESELAELSRVFWFVKKNIEYRQDPHQYDLYSTASRTLQVQSGDCFTLDTSVIVRSKASGGYEIKTLGELETSWPAYDALTYDFAGAKWTFKPITAWTLKGEKEVFESHLGNGSDFRHTADHSVWWLDGQNESKKINEAPLGRYLEDNRATSRRVLVARKLPALNVSDISQSQAYITGIYAAEGFSDGGHVRIAQDKADIREKIETHLKNVGASFSKSARDVNSFYSILKSGLKDSLYSQGTNSFNMSFGRAVFASSEEVIRAAYEAYCDGDGYVPKETSALFNRVRCISATSSNKLAQELRLMLMILGQPWHDYLQLNHGGAGTKPIHRISQYSETTQVARRVVPDNPDLTYSNLKSMNYMGQELVCDITVADTHNFVLDNGMIVHNCDDHLILVDSLIANLGYIPGAKVISRDGANWHIYAVTSVFPRHNPQASTARYIALDTTQPPSYPGWEPPREHHKYVKIVTFTEAGPLIQNARQS